MAATRTLEQSTATLGADFCTEIVTAPGVLIMGQVYLVTSVVWTLHHPVLLMYRSGSAIIMMSGSMWPLTISGSGAVPTLNVTVTLLPECNKQM